MKILVLAQDYPDNNGGVTLAYIHTRNIYYSENGIDVTVLNFSAKTSYIKDGIRVVSLSEYELQKESFDILVLHAANIRNHFRFIKKYGDNFPHFLFFFHGHEVMRINHDYAKPYEYMKKNIFMYLFQDVYDCYKLYLWRKFIPKMLYKSHFVFVSYWMRDMFVKNVKITIEQLHNKYSITYNSVGREFEESTYDEKTEKEYDFVTIRANLDGSKYAIDIVNKYAHNTPEGRFLVVGKGSIFNHFPKADNITWLNMTMSHDEIVRTLNTCRYALMPTRTDAQGLMMCEMAAFGIPVITSNIPVCHEVFDGFENAYLVDEDINLDSFLSMSSRCVKDVRYYKDKTVGHELDIIRVFEQ